MDANIEKWRVQQYAANVHQLSQQKGSRFASLVRNETFTGKAEFFDVLGLSTAQAKGARAADTPNLNIDHDRRMVTTTMYEWATLVDRKDKLAQIHMPESEYAKSAMMALGRAMDDAIIAGAVKKAASGETGSSFTYVPNLGMISSVASNAIANLNVLALKTAKYIMDKNEVEGQRHIACRAVDIQNLLGDTTVTSADYNTVRALVMGEVDTFLGFKFHRTERLIAPSADVDGNNFIFNVATGAYDAGGTDLSTDYSLYKTAFAFVGDGIILGKNEGVKSFIEPRADKSYDIQVYASMDFGAVRLEEAKVVPIFVKA